MIPTLRPTYRYFVDSGEVVQIGDNEAATVVVRTCCSHPSLSPAFASSPEVHKVPLRNAQGSLLE